MVSRILAQLSSETHKPITFSLHKSLSLSLFFLSFHPFSSPSLDFMNASIIQQMAKGAHTHMPLFRVVPNDTDIYKSVINHSLYNIMVYQYLHMYCLFNIMMYPNVVVKFGLKESCTNLPTKLLFPTPMSCRGG